MTKLLITAAIVGATLVGCVPVDRDFHGSVGGSSETPVTHIAGPPITIEGNGESVQTVDLQTGGYTVGYRATTFTLIVAPVLASGGDDSPIINAISPDIHGTASGMTTFHSSGRTTFHVFNTQGAWALKFTPL